MIEEEFSNEKKIELIEKYGPLTLCSIEERYWAVNGKYLVEIKNEEIERLKDIIKRYNVEQIKKEKREQLENILKDYNKE